MKKMRVGIIGCGTIGSALAKALIRRFQKSAALRYFCEIHEEKAIRLKRALSRSHSPIRITTLAELVRKSDLIIEAASSMIAPEVVKRGLAEHKQILVMSVGGLIAIRGLENILRRSRGKLWIPSGAIAGVDGLLAAREAGIRSVTLVTKKSPAGLREAPYFSKKKFPRLRGNEERCVFKGSADEAVREFPKNVNVAAVLSLAGIGFLRTKVQIWTSRAYRKNQHEISIEGRSGHMSFKVANVPSPWNPKTSSLAIYSAMATLRKILSSFRIGT